MCEPWLKPGDKDQKVKGDLSPVGYKWRSIPRMMVMIDVLWPPLCTW